MGINLLVTEIFQSVIFLSCFPSSLSIFLSAFFLIFHLLFLSCFPFFFFLIFPLSLFQIFFLSFPLFLLFSNFPSSLFPPLFPPSLTFLKFNDVIQRRSLSGIAILLHSPLFSSLCLHTFWRSLLSEHLITVGSRVSARPPVVKGQPKKFQQSFPVFNRWNNCCSRSTHPAFLCSSLSRARH